MSILEQYKVSNKTEFAKTVSYTNYRETEIEISLKISPKESQRDSPVGSVGTYTVQGENL